jgi:hypothetical protein
MGFAMDDSYDEYRSGFGAMALSPDGVDAVCDGLFRDGAPREAIQILNALDMLPEPVRSQNRKNLVWLLRFAPRPSHVDDFPKDKVSEEDYQPINDPVWDGPNLSLLRDGDPVPMAKLLLQGQAPPQEVGHMLGRMLLPSKSYRGFRLTVTFDKRKPSWMDSAKDIAIKLKAHRRFQELNAQEPRPPRKKIIDRLITEFERERSWVEDAVATDNKRVFEQTQGWLGYVRDEESD